MKEISISRNRSLYPIRIIRSGPHLRTANLIEFPFELIVTLDDDAGRRGEGISKSNPSFYFFFSLAIELAIEYKDIFATTNTGDGEFIITGMEGDLYRFF